MLAHVTPPPLDVVRLQGFRIVRKRRLHAAHDVTAIDVEHGAHVPVVRRPHQHRRLIDGSRKTYRTRGIAHSRTT